MKIKLIKRGVNVCERSPSEIGSNFLQDSLTEKNQMKIKLIRREVNVCERSVRNWMNDEGFTQRKTK